MKVDPWKPIAACSVALFAAAVACGGSSPPPAPPPAAGGACNNQPNMASALNDLRAARGYLERAEHDKGGWRARAIQHATVAIRETENGCVFADTH
jgi:hypothetical protein